MKRMMIQDLPETEYEKESIESFRRSRCSSPSAAAVLEYLNMEPVEDRSSGAEVQEKVGKN